MKEVKQNGRPITVRVSESTGQSTAGALFFELQFVPHHVVILSPSFGCPAIVKNGAPLRLFILTDGDFEELYRTDPDKTKPRVKAVINRMLKILKWDAGKQIEDRPLYGDTARALPNIGVAYLGDMHGFKDGRLKDNDGALFGLLRDSTRSAYGALNVKYLFQIDLAPGIVSTSMGADGLYEAVWVVPDPQDPKRHALYAELQDRATRTFVNGHLKDRTQAYKIDGAFDFTLDDTASIQNRHPILITGKDKLNLGHLTDVHVSSRQFAFRKSRAQVLQTPAEASPDSEILGDQVNVTYNTLKDLLDQIGRAPPTCWCLPAIWWTSTATSIRPPRNTGATHCKRPANFGTCCTRRTTRTVRTTRSTSMI